MSSFKTKAIDLLIKQPAEMILILVILGMVAWLAQHGKDSLIPYVMNIGGGSVALLLVMSLSRWIGAQLEMAISLLPDIRDSLNKLSSGCTETLLLEIRDAVRETADSHSELAVLMERESESFATMSRSLAMVARRTIVLLVEDNTFDQILIRGLLRDVIHGFGLELEIVSTLREAWPKIHRAVVILLDVGLPGSTEAQVEEFVCDVSSFCPIVIYSATEYTDENFPAAKARFRKGSEPASVISAILSILKAELLK